MTIRYMTTEEASRTKEAAVSNRDKAMVGVLLHGGLRIGELCGLQVRDFDFEARTVRVERIVVPITKTLKGIEEGRGGKPLYKPRRQLGIYMPDHSIRKVLPKDLPALCKAELPGTKEFVRVGTKSTGEYGRAVPFIGKDETTSELWTRLKAEAEGRERLDWIWVAGPQRGKENHWGGRLSYPAAREVITRAMKRAGLDPDKCHPHVTRHTWATSWIRGGGDLVSLQRMGGWSNITMVAKYAALVADDLVIVAAKVDVGF